MIPPDLRIATNAFRRLLFMALFFALFGFARLSLWTVVMIQLIAHIFTGRVTQWGVRWGQEISSWMYKVMLFMSYNTERMPFPFASFGAEED